MWNEILSDGNSQLHEAVLYGNIQSIPDIEFSESNLLLQGRQKLTLMQLICKTGQAHLLPKPAFTVGALVNGYTNPHKRNMSVCPLMILTKEKKLHVIPVPLPRLSPEVSLADFFFQMDKLGNRPCDINPPPEPWLDESATVEYDWGMRLPKVQQPWSYHHTVNQTMFQHLAFVNPKFFSTLLGEVFESHWRVKSVKNRTFLHVSMEYSIHMGNFNVISESEWMEKDDSGTSSAGYLIASVVKNAKAKPTNEQSRMLHKMFGVLGRESMARLLAECLDSDKQHPKILLDLSDAFQSAAKYPINAASLPALEAELHKLGFSMFICKEAKVIKQLPDSMFNEENLGFLVKGTPAIQHLAKNGLFKEVKKRGFSKSLCRLRNAEGDTLFHLVDTKALPPKYWSGEILLLSNNKGKRVFEHLPLLCLSKFCGSPLLYELTKELTPWWNRRHAKALKRKRIRKKKLRIARQRLKQRNSNA
jgi:hypothetical protein